MEKIRDRNNIIIRPIMNSMQTVSTNLQHTIM